MKKIRMLLIAGNLVLFLAALQAPSSAPATEPEPPSSSDLAPWQPAEQPGDDAPQGVSVPPFSFPDSLEPRGPWSGEHLPRRMEVEEIPLGGDISVLVVARENLPARVMVINRNILRLGAHFRLSNGQADNWGPFPDSYLDARTLSFPAPR